MLRRKQAPSPLTYISAASEFQGNLHVEGNLRVDGIIHGTIEVLGNMEVAATGLVEGPEVRAHNLIVHGVIKARVVVTGELMLSATARLEGDVVANALDIAPGAFYHGYIETKDVSKATLPISTNVPELSASREEI